MCFSSYVEKVLSCKQDLTVAGAPSQAMLALPDTGQLLRFVKGESTVDLNTGRSSLEAAGRYSVSTACS